MFLKKIEIQGFKSLADKIELQFNPGVSAIVGPNGSGKSNIADAVRWVLGEQSARSLRGAKMEDVIFSGSDRRKAVGMAEVSLTLDNSTYLFNSEYSEITVTRRVYRSGESEYFINKTPCRLKDIHELFMDTGIGREGYSIIGQGKIEEILSAKSDERRVIIEEAAGIVKYKNRKVQAVKKLNDTEQNLLRINDIITELKSQVGPLEEQARKAKEYLACKNKLDDLEINLLINQVEEQKGKLADLNSSDEDVKFHLIDIETTLRNMESCLEEQKLTVNILDERISDVQTEIYNIGSLIEKNEAEIMVAGERNKGLAQRRESLAAEIKELAAREKLERERSAGEEEAYNKLLQQIAEKESELEILTGELLAKESALAEERRRLEEKKGDIIDLLNEMAGVKNTINSAEVELNSLERRKNQLTGQLEELARDKTAALQKEAAVKARMAEIRANEESLLKEEADIKKKSRIIAGEMERLMQLAGATREALQESNSRLKALTALQDSYEGYYWGVKEVLIAGKKGSLRGICGVVAELIKVDKEYETAVEVALGGALQNIVTETDDNARMAIEFLKKTGAGRATFLPINTIKSKDTDIGKYKNCRGFVGHGPELVEYDRKFSGVVKYLLGRVIVIDNIRNAVELARVADPNIRIVTLEGDVVNPGGAMTGGAYNKQGANLLGRKREIEEVSARKEQLESELRKLEEKLHKAKSENESLQEEMARVGDLLQKLNIDRSNAAKDSEVIGQEINRINNAITLTETERDSINDEINNIICRINNDKNRLQELSRQDEETRTAIEEAREFLAGLEAECSRLSESVTRKKVELAGLRQEEISLAQLIKRAKDTVREINLNIKYKERQIDEIDRQSAALAEEIEKYSGEIKRLTGEKGDKEDTLNSLKNEKQAVITAMAENEAKIKSISREMALLKEKIHAADVRRARLEIEVENLLNKLADEFQITYEEALLRKTEIHNKREVTGQIRQLKEAIAAIGTVNLGAIEEYDRVRERYEFLRGQYLDLQQAKESLYKVIAEMDQIMTKKFSETFREINANFGEVFNKFFGGGRAELVLTESDNLLESGIEIIAQPPGKKPQHLSLLSGGEKALTAISLLFAILRTKPSPFCILDEIEASLDAANVVRFADYLKNFSEKTQFIVITHRKGTMEAADVLYGVTMDESGVTKLVSVKLTGKPVRADKVS